MYIAIRFPSCGMMMWYPELTEEHLDRLFVEARASVREALREMGVVVCDPEGLRC